MTVYERKDANIGSSEVLRLTPSDSVLPKPEMLSLKQVSWLARRMSGYFELNPPKVQRSGRLFTAATSVYGLQVQGESPKAVRAKSRCASYWRRQLENRVNTARLDAEAKAGSVGGKNTEAPIYASDATVRRFREKREITMEYLRNCEIVRTGSGERVNLLEFAKKAAQNRFAELYSTMRNFQEVAKTYGMGWLFVTLTAPPEYHPNPSVGKYSYDPRLGLKASHTYLALAWSRIRSLLNRRGLTACPTGYFGARTAETHKDGTVHWHLIIFMPIEVVKEFEKACDKHFPFAGQTKIVVGDDDKGSASNYVFKYLVKDIDLAAIDDAFDELINEGLQEDQLRERDDLSSIRNTERVKAALRAMNIRQYQSFGHYGAVGLLKAINQLNEQQLGEVDDYVKLVKENIWRNTLGLKYLLTNSSLFRGEHGGVVPIQLLKEPAITRYGEKYNKTIGIRIGLSLFLKEKVTVINSGPSGKSNA